MGIWIGTSGYSYPEWKGSFYPATIPASRMLAFYAERLRTVEINASFYRMPTEKTLQGWARATPEAFRFTLKAPRRITHDARLRECGELVRQFFDVAGALGPKLGALLFQLPPSLRKDLALFDTFLEAFPPRVPAAFEFRHASWLDAAVYARLRERRIALCVADSETSHMPVEITADIAYFRLRDEGYTPDDLDRWASTIETHTAACRDVYVYFKHEAAGTGPAFATRLIERLAPPAP